MPVECIWFGEEQARSLPQTEIIQNVYIIDLGVQGGAGSAGLRIHDVSGRGENEFFIGSGTAMLIPLGVDGIYQVIIEATKYAGEGRVGVYTIEAIGDAGVVDTAANVVAQERVEERLILTSSSEKPIRSITIRGSEVAIGKVCFIFDLNF